MSTTKEYTFVTGIANKHCNIKLVNIPQDLPTGILRATVIEYLEYAIGEDAEQPLQSMLDSVTIDYNSLVDFYGEG